jgi:transposase
MTDKEKIQDLELKLTVALSRIEQLEALILSQALKKTSQNSHVPPSVDLTRKNQSLRKKSNKPVGGQDNHEGHTLKMSEKPDQIEHLQPNFCPSCGNDLSNHSFEQLSARQVLDIPPIIPFIKEYRCMGTTCSCGEKVQGTYPEGVNSPIQYGENVQSLVIYQSYYQFIPFQRLQDFFRNVCQVSICKGTIENIIRRNALKAEPAYEVIKEAISVASYVGADETGYSLNGQKGWFWVWQNAALTYLVATDSRSKAVVEKEFPTGLPMSIVGSDRFAAQISTSSKGKQICLAHLLRDSNFLIEAEKSKWAEAFKKLLQDAIILKQLKDEYAKNDPEALNIEQELNQILDTKEHQYLFQEAQKYRQTITFFNSIVKLRQALLTFLYHKAVPFHNNGSERAFRMVKLKDKISGQFKSLQHQFAVLRSVIDTAIKNGQNVYTVIKNIIKMPRYKVAG